VVLKELLVLPLEVLFEDDAADLDDVVLFSQPSVLLPKRRVEIRVVVDLARAAGAGVEPLRRFTVSLEGVRLEQVTPFCRKSQPAFAVAKLHGLNEPLIVEVVERVTRKIQVVFRHDPKDADGGKRPTVFTVQFVHSVTVNHQFALVTARQVEIPHQPVPRIAIVPVARIVHAWPFVAAIAHIGVAWISPSSIGHGSLRCFSAVGFVVREDALAVAARAHSGSAEVPGRVAAAFGAWSWENPVQSMLDAERRILPRADATHAAAADQMLLLTLYAHCVQASTVLR
jgi:hypothetical protein